MRAVKLKLLSTSQTEDQLTEKVAEVKTELQLTEKLTMVMTRLPREPWKLPRNSDTLSLIWSLDPKTSTSSLQSAEKLDSDRPMLIAKTSLQTTLLNMPKSTTPLSELDAPTAFDTLFVFERHLKPQI